ncbi:MAG: hypothetical protein FJ263_04530 [Planctomycetes bacterium]|nr:hypothetical protein [Planctomycetota bacterium]
MKKSKLKTALFITLPIIVIVVLLCWYAVRIPCDSRYYTEQMKVKYATLQAVIDSVYSGDGELVNEACGFKRMGSDFKGQPVTDSGRPIQYYPSGKMAFHDGRFFLQHKGRWIWYPEAPWLPLIEMMHGSKSH